VFHVKQSVASSVNRAADRSAAFAYRSTIGEHGRFGKPTATAPSHDATIVDRREPGERLAIGGGPLLPFGRLTLRHPHAVDEYLSLPGLDV
jgi:hypothetical protein